MGFQTLCSRILNGVERVFVMLVFCSTTLSLTQKSFSRFYRRKMAKTDRKLLKCLTLMTPKSKFEDSRVWQIVFQTIFKSLHVIFHCHFSNFHLKLSLQNIRKPILTNYKSYFLTFPEWSIWPFLLGNEIPIKYITCIHSDQFSSKLNFSTKIRLL